MEAISRFARAAGGRLCGRGNNGGDGFVAARTLVQRGVDVSVFVLGLISDVRGDARVNLEILGRLGVTVVEVSDGQAWELHLSEVRDCTLIVDAIFGTGLNAPVSGLIESVITDINASSIPVVSIDLPSGLSADSSETRGESIEAETTVTLAAPKLPLVLPPAETRAGDIVIADIGIPTDVLDSVDGPRIELMTRSSAREHITPRTADSHKGDYGHVLVVAGSRGKTGAAHLSGIGALRSGAGLVTVATAASCQAIVAAMAPEYMTVGLDETDAGLDPDGVDRLLEMARDVVALGPGLGQAPGTQAFIKALVDRATCPLVVDADGLNAFSGDPIASLAARAATSSSRRTGKWRAWSACPPTRCRRAASKSPEFRRLPSPLCRAEGAPDADRDAGREGVHQPDGQSRDVNRRYG